jgi:glyoxylase-like metal-dependent hydrolase (beta-lactamase superfamily II)
MAAVSISSVSGNSQWLDGGSMFGNVPRPVWTKWLVPDEAGRIKLMCRAMLIEVGSTRILCETGIGAFFDPKMADRFGVTEASHVLLESLSALGIDHTEIDAVILSHLHFDHAGGLLPTFAEASKGNDALLFPKADYYVGAVAWERACNPHPRDRASFIPGMTDKLIRSGRLKIVSPEANDEYFGGAVSFRFTDGHTPGQMHTIVKGDTKTAIFAGDLIPGTSWVHLPVTMGYDRYPELVIDEKNCLYRDFIDEDFVLFYTHDPKYAISGIEQDAAGKFLPVNMVTEVKQYQL